MGTPGAFLYSPRGLRLRRRGAYSPRLTHRLRGVSPQGKRLTMICESLALLHPLLSLTHWIFRSLMLPYKSSSHSAKCVRCAPLKGKRLTTFCASLCSYKMCSLCIASLRGPPIGGQDRDGASYRYSTPYTLSRFAGLRPGGKHVTGFSDRFALLQIQFLCHLKGKRENR